MARGFVCNVCISLSFRGPTLSIDLNSKNDKTYKVTPMIESLRTTQIAFFRCATPSGFPGRWGGDEVQKVFGQESVQEKVIWNLQGGKTFCASFCASLIAGSRREFSVSWLCLFVAGVLSEMHEVRTFAPCKAFLFDMFAFFGRLKITLDSEQPMLKEKRIIPSVWGGIKGFEHF